MPGIPSRTGRELTDEDLEQVEEQVREHHARHRGASARSDCRGIRSKDAADAAALMTRGPRRASIGCSALAARCDLPWCCTRRTAPPSARSRRSSATASSGRSSTGTRRPAEVTRAIVDAGYFVSVTPEVVYRERDRELVELVPLESLLVESDAPWPYGGEFTSLPSGPWLAAGWPKRSRRSRTARRRRDVPALRQHLPPLRPRLALSRPWPTSPPATVCRPPRT